MAFWPWKIVRHSVRTVFMTPHYIWAHWPNQTLCAQNSSFPKNISCFKHVRVDSNIYECCLIIFEHADLSKPWHPVLFFWTAPCFQLSKQWDFLRIVCHRKCLNGGKWKVESVFLLVLALFISVILRLQQLTQTPIFLAVLAKMCLILFTGGIYRKCKYQIKGSFVSLRKAKGLAFLQQDLKHCWTASIKGEVVSP